ncbi:MAG TPA: carbohydrate ABC transporter permease [Propionibacteriaceae bacterium]
MTAVQSTPAPVTDGPSQHEPDPGLRPRRRQNPVFWLVMVLLTVIILAPLLFMLLTSIKTAVEARSAPPTLLPTEPTLGAFRTLFFGDETSPVLRWLVNSLVAATLHSLLVVTISSMAGYALARMEFPFKKLIFGLIIGTLFLPSFIFMMPNFEILNRLGWLDTVWSIVVPGAAGAFGVFFMRQFFFSIPIALEESARIDGASPWRIFRSIILPNSRPALVTLAVISFLANWNDFVFPIYVLFSPERLTLPVGLTKLQGSYTIDYPVIMAGAALASVPVLVLYIFVQRYVIEGVASSGIKG